MHKFIITTLVLITTQMIMSMQDPYFHDQKALSFSYFDCSYFDGEQLEMLKQIDAPKINHDYDEPSLVFKKKFEVFSLAYKEWYVHNQVTQKPYKRVLIDPPIDFTKYRRVLIDPPKPLLLQEKCIPVEAPTTLIRVHEIYRSLVSLGKKRARTRQEVIFFAASNNEK